MISKTQAIEELQKLSRTLGADPDCIKVLQEILGLYLQVETLSKRVSITPPSVEWYTPVFWIVPVVEVLGDIDLDPASSHFANNQVRARAYYTKEEDGLSSPWTGRIFCNPPYGRMTQKFLLHGLKEYAEGRVTEAIFLVNNTRAAWYLRITPAFDARFAVTKRIAFCDQSGQIQNGPRYYNDFLYLGPKPETFLSVFAKADSNY